MPEDLHEMENRYWYALVVSGMEPRNETLADIVREESARFVLPGLMKRLPVTGERASVEIAPSVKGLATIYDKDILIYCVSQLMAKKNAGEPLAQTLHLNAHELLVWTNRATSGDAYRRLKDAFERLRGTTRTANFETNGEDEVQDFGLIESFRIVRETRSGRISELQVKLSDWVYRIIQGSEVLTLRRDYDEGQRWPWGSWR